MAFSDARNDRDMAAARGGMQRAGGGTGNNMGRSGGGYGAGAGVYNLQQRTMTPAAARAVAMQPVRQIQPPDWWRTPFQGQGGALPIGGRRIPFAVR
jgi:hypothetical protein